MSAFPLNAGGLEAPFLAGVMACCPLYGITCAQAAYYYRTYSKDHLILKGFVGLLLVMETAHMMLIGQAAFFIFITCKVPERTLEAFTITSAFAVSVTFILLITFFVQW
ncbi:hypothetical protein FPV67DRAFT_1491454 [Lyophyllum atratum]|nr:hypothetical protein FPV67DRAFT_1491454 [Lyophyllum atratum]